MTLEIHLQNEIFLILQYILGQLFPEYPSKSFSPAYIH